MCADQDRFEVTVTPRYLMEVSCVIVELATVIWSCMGWGVFESTMSLVFVGLSPSPASSPCFTLLPSTLLSTSPSPSSPPSPPLPHLHHPLNLTLLSTSPSPSPSSPPHLHPSLHLTFTLLPTSPPSTPIPTMIAYLPLLSPFLSLPSQVRVTQFTILVVSLSSTTTPTGGNTVARTLQYGRRRDCECIVTITIKPATLTPEWGEHIEL